MMRIMANVIVCAAVALLAFPPLAHSQDIIGKARVIDGDTISVARKRIRLHGIDAPEAAQTCAANRQRWKCGSMATSALRKIIGNQRVHCRPKDIDQYRRVVAVCTLPSGIDVNDTMIVQGYALAYRRFSHDYVRQERVAKKAKFGMWRGIFTKPWEWRQAQRTRPPAANDHDPSACMIKGNISRNGRIYHVRGGQYYSRTKINQPKGERMFCTEAEAQAVRWRRSRG
jgi:endonuclease YncB( thermonuclease family)